MDNFSSRVAAASLRLLPRTRLSRAVGRLADARVSAGVLDKAVDAFVRAYGVDLSEAEVPAGGFPSFDAFFTRTLRPGARPINSDPGVLVSPADGRFDDSGAILGDGSFVVKGQVYQTGELLGHGGDAAQFEGGAYAVVYLAPPDYHRVHAPVRGRVRAARHVGGTLYPVNEIGTRHVPGLFAKNERIAVIQQVEGGGAVASILVGAIGVGRITLSFDPMRSNTGSLGETRDYGSHGPLLERGAELGMFHLGSTVVLLTSKELATQFTVERGARTRVGERLALVGGR